MENEEKTPGPVSAKEWANARFKHRYTPGNCLFVSAVFTALAIINLVSVGSGAFSVAWLRHVLFASAHAVVAIVFGWAALQLSHRPKRPADPAGTAKK
jgi:hypothetical protein